MTPKCWSPLCSCPTGQQLLHGTGSVPKDGVSSSPSGSTTFSLSSRQWTLQFQEMSNPFPRLLRDPQEAPKQLGQDGNCAPGATRQLWPLHCCCTSGLARGAEIKPGNLKSKWKHNPKPHSLDGKKVSLFTHIQEKQPLQKSWISFCIS